MSTEKERVELVGKKINRTLCLLERYVVIPQVLLFSEGHIFFSVDVKKNLLQLDEQQKYQAS